MDIARVALLGSAAVAAVAGCSSNRPNDGWDGADASASPQRVSAAAIIESPAARERVAELRAQFVARSPVALRTPPGAQGRVTPAPAAVLKPGLATSFEATDDAHLRAVFPDGATRAVPRSATALLPRHANDAVELEDDTTHVRLTFALRGATSAPVEVAGGLAVYRGALSGNDVVHRVDPEGTEDYVVFERAPSKEELVYDVDVSRVLGLRLVGNVLEFLDGGGAPRLRMAPPFLVDADGATREAKTAVEGCKYDTDPAGPWGRPVTRPGAPRCTVRITWDGVAYPAMLDPTWSATGSMTVPRHAHTATLLSSGKVLITGGLSGATILASAELYDGTSSFAATGSMSQGRYSHTATLLASGQVLIAGGSSGAAGTAERFDGTSTFAPTGCSMSIQRSRHTATLLSSGKVLVAGGQDDGGSDSATADLYDPATDCFTATSPMTVPRSRHAAALLPSGKVLIAGGRSSGTAVSSAEFFDGTSSFVAVGAMSEARMFATATTLPSGWVLVAGGLGSSGALPAGELFDGTSTFWQLPMMADARYQHTATLLSSGWVLLAGGNVDTAELFDGQGAFTPTSAMSNVRAMASATRLPSGSVLVAGGWTGSTDLSAAELFSPTAAGQGCTVGGACLSGVCNNGVCCTGACSGACLKCASGTGACVAVKNADDPDTCTGTKTCDANGACHLKTGQACTGGTDCASGACDEKCCAASCGGACQTCDGTGACVTVANAPDPNTCTGASSCDGSGNCKLVAGQTCTGDTTCVTGFCNDKCCVSQCVGTCKTCDGSGACLTVANADDPDSCTGSSTCDPLGVCKTKSGQSCQVSTDCVSGACNGNCCSAACSGTCKTCDGTGACVAVMSADDPDSCTGGNTCDASGACKAKSGQACTAPADCASGNCVDGYCCNTGCGGACDRCNVGGKLGTCSPAPAGDPGQPSCSPQACDGTNGLCPGSAACTSDAECAAGYFCSLGGQCTSQKAQGSACSAATDCKTSGCHECATGFCVDGFCCDSACNSTPCVACSAARKGQGADGTCGNVAADTDPHDGCAPDPGYPASCKADGVCDGNGICRQYAKSNVQCGASSCSGTMVSGQLCNGAGNCVASQGSDCAPYECAAGACTTTCAATSDCAQGAYCDSTGHCKTLRTKGAACTSGTECATGFCADGVCCDSACSGQCQACDVAPNAGSCSIVSGAPHAGHPQCAGTAPCGGTCDGVNAASCKYAGSTVSCGSSCTNATQTASSCDGNGGCAKGAPTPCAAGYACDGTTTCKTSCSADDDCVAGYGCAAGKCTPKGGAKCSNDRLSSITTTGTVSCAPYVCDSSSGTCRQVCSSIDDCATPNVCDATTHQCVAAAEQAADSGTTGGCGCRVAGTTGGDGSAWGALLALGLAGARRRRGRTPRASRRLGG